jgi:hypothetical protein
VLQILSSHVRQRLGYAVLSGVKAAASSIARTVYVLWLQTTGLVFGAFTVFGGSQMVRLYRQHAWASDAPRFWTTLGFTLVCLVFTMVSFSKAKRREAQSRKS